MLFTKVVNCSVVTCTRQLAQLGQGEELCAHCNLERVHAKASFSMALRQNQAGLGPASLCVGDPLQPDRRPSHLGPPPRPRPPAHSCPTPQRNSVSHAVLPAQHDLFILIARVLALYQCAQTISWPSILLDHTSLTAISSARPPQLSAVQVTSKGSWCNDHREKCVTRVMLNRLASTRATSAQSGSCTCPVWQSSCNRSADGRDASSSSRSTS